MNEHRSKAENHMQSEIGQDKLEQIFQSFRQGVIYQQADGRVIFINQKAREIFGPDPESDLGHDSDSCRWRLIYEDGSICPDEEHPSIETLRKVKALNGQIRGVLWEDRPDKPVTWISIDTNPIMGRDRKTPEAVVTIFTDITKQKQADDLRISSYRKQQIAMDLAKLVQWEYDVDTDLFVFDDRFYALFGTSSSEQGGNRMSSGEYARRFLPPEDVPVVANEIKAALETTDPDFTRQIEHRIIRTDGQIRHIIVRFGIIQDETGRTIRTMGANQDITALKVAEEQLREAQKVSHTGSWQLDIPNRVLTLSDEALNLFDLSGKPPGTLEDLRACVDPEDRLAVTEAWSGALQGKPYALEYQVGCDDDRRWISERAVVKFAPDGTPLSGVGTVQDITERRMATMRLESSERRFRALIEASAQIVWNCDPQGYVREDSPTWRAYTGQTFDQCKGLGYAQAMHPEDREKIMSGWRRNLEQGEPVTSTYRLRHHSGQWRWNQARTAPVKDNAGRILSWMGMNIDIHDQREAEDALKQSQEKFHQAMYHAPIGEAIVSLEGRWIDVNPSMCHIVGYTREELLSTDFQSITYPEDLDADLECVRQLLEGEIPTCQMDKRYIHKDGDIVWTQLNVALVRGSKGEPSYFISQIQDISERKRNELAIKESERRFQAIINASPIPLALNDENDAIIYINPAFAERFGYSQKEIPTLEDWWLKAYPDAAYREDVKQRWRLRAENSEKHDKPFVPMEVRICCKDGAYRTVQVTSTPLSGFAQKTSLITLYDITQIKNISERLQTLLATASDGIHVLDKRGNVVEFSESFARMLGYTAEETARLNVADWEAQIDPEELETTIQELIRSSTTFETKHRRKDGSLLDVEINAKSIVLDGRELLYASSRDITERKRALSALAESEERFNLAISGSDDGIWDWTISSNTLFWSPRFKEILGYSDDEIDMSLDKWSSLVHPDSREATRAALRDHLREDLPYDIEYRILHKSGEYIWLRSRGKAVRDENGRALRMAGSIKDITDQKKAELRLKEALEFNDTVLLKSPLAMGVYRQDGQCVLANEALAAMAGTTRDKVLSQNFHQIESWKASGLLDDCLAALADGQQRKQEMHTISSFGKEIWASVLIFPTMLNNEPHLVIQMTDQSEIQRANDALNSTTSRLKLATKAAALGIWVRNLSNDVFIWDDRMLEIYEVPEEVQASGLYYDFWRSRCHPDDLAATEQILQEALQGRDELDMHFRILLPGGRTRHIHATALHEADDEGTPIRMIGTNQDITALKQTEESLQHALSEQSIILETASVGITMMRNRAMLRSNVKMSEIFGYTQEEIVGLETKILYPSLEEYQQFEREAYPVILRGETYTTECQMKRKDGSLLWVGLTGKAIDPGDQEAGSIWVLEDISESKIRESALREAKAAAEQANRMKSEFLANMSHEIRTPMNAVLGLSQLLLNTELEKLQRDYLEKLYNASQSLLGIINDILDYSKIEAGKLDLESTEFPLDEILDSTAKLFAFSAETKGLELIFDTDPNMPPLFIGDPLRIKQVLNNLLGNAIKFTKSGHVKLTMRVLAQQDDKLTLQVAISDSGIGMNPEQLKRLFNAFEQADSSTTRKFGGTGLGLTISKHLIEMMDGQIRVESKPNVGSVFTFTLKLVVSGSKAAQHSAADLHGMRTLLVEDQEGTREMMLGILNSWGFLVETAESGEDGLNMALNASASGKPFELILVDWKLPGMDGVEMAKNIRKNEAGGQKDRQHTIVIMVTAFGRQEAQKVIRDMDFDAVLDKPVIASQLYNLLAHLQGYQPEKDTPKSWSSLREASELLVPIAGAKILLVEDNLTNQLVANDLLVNMGLDVYVASSGLEAVNMASAQQFDVILMDLQMPEMDGIEATRRIRELPERKDVPIIALTAAAMQKDREVCLAAGMDDFVAKPIDVDSLCAALLRFVPPRKKPGPANADCAPSKPAATAEVEPFELKGMDLPAAVARLSNNWGLLSRALAAFAREFSQSADSLDKYLEEGSREEALRLFHTIKSSAGMVGAMLLSEISQDLESELKAGKSISPEPFRQELTKILSAIATLTPDKPAPAKSGDSHRLRELAEDIFARVSKAGFVPPDLLAEMGVLLEGRGQGETAKKLKTSIESFNYKAAAEQLITISESHGFKLEG